MANAIDHLEVVDGSCETEVVEILTAMLAHISFREAVFRWIQEQHGDSVNVVGRAR